MSLRKLVKFCVLGLAAVVAVPASDSARGAEEGELSEAQVLLFRMPHLDGIEDAASITYEYRREADGEEGFVDTVAMDIAGIEPDGSKDVAVKFLTGPRAKGFGEFPGFRGNPVIMVFLEDDVQRMAEKFDGGRIYLRNRIRNAFHDQATAVPVSFSLDGRMVDGKQVTVAPFVGDRYAERLGAYERKVYEFIVSSDVPGGIYRIHSYVPSESLAGKPLIEDTLTYRGTGS